MHATISWKECELLCFLSVHTCASQALLDLILDICWFMSCRVKSSHHVIVHIMKYARQPSNPEACKVDHACMAQVVYIWRHPTAIVQLPQVV